MGNQAQLILTRQRLFVMRPVMHTGCHGDLLTL